MEFLNLMLVQCFLILAMSLDVFGEPFLELLVGVKNFWHDEVKECPEFSHGILDWCSCQQKLVSCLKVHQDAPSLRSNIFDSLCFVKDHVLPVKSVECFFIRDC